ncbi:hypothetical protein [Mycobacteroides abscessus]|uniref:hypothetical protein n=1 Tax=Mycobacteroides abscessus TaxID=36809 RepID=UPI0011B1C9D9|nr:hypothetical protein [Mycobacteroides abscessus]
MVPACSTTATASPKRTLAADAARARAFNRKRRDQTIPGATHRGQRWSLEDIDIACDPNIPVLEAALQLGRTTHAVYATRHRYNPDGATNRNKWTKSVTYTPASES